MPLIEESDGLLMAAVALSMHQLDDVSPRAIDQTLWDYAQMVRSRVRSSSPSARLAHLHDLLFDQIGFVGNSDDYYNPMNSYLPAVLQTHQGMPITLSLIYKIVAERAGLHVMGINAPIHFLAAVQYEDKIMLVDPFFSGRVLSREEAFDRIEQAAGRAVPRVDQMLPPATHRQWIARILQNLITIFQHTHDREKLDAIMELRGVLMTER